MSRGVFQPITQVRLTNVAIVRLSRAGKRFEIACYRNKVVNWRNKLETDIDEVLQINSIFQNVSKGVLAKKKDILDAFGTVDETEVCKVILEKGEMQVSDKERQAAMDSTFRDIATIVSEKCVDPTSNRPYTVGMIQNAMRDIHYATVATRSAKQQALDVIRQLAAVMPIARACMRLRVVADAEGGPALRAALEALGVDCGSGAGAVERRTVAEWTLDVLVDPGLFRKVEELVREQTGGQGQVQVLQLAVQEEGEADMDTELARKELLALQLGREKEGRMAAAREKAAGAAAGGGGDDGEGSPPGKPGGAASTAAAAAASGCGGGGGGGGGGFGGDAGGGGKGGKKSKKAKRREKEAAEERAAMAAEAATRQEERRRQRRVAAGAPADAEEASAGADAAASGGETAVASGDAATMGEKDSREAAVAADIPVSKLRCNTCGIGFLDTAAHREHFKTDWHRYNLKMKMKGVPAVSEEEFTQVDAEELFFSEHA